MRRSRRAPGACKDTAAITKLAMSLGENLLARRDAPSTASLAETVDRAQHGCRRIRYAGNACETARSVEERAAAVHEVVREAARTAIEALDCAQRVGVDLNTIAVALRAEYEANWRHHEARRDVI